MISEPLLLEAVAYFKSNNGFARIFEHLKRKYKRLGAIGGTIELKSLSPKERDALTGFLRKDYLSRKNALVKVENFQKALENTKFQGLLLEDILYEYFGGDLVTNKEARTIYLHAQNVFFTKIIEKYKGSIAGEWLRHILEIKNNAYRIFMQRYDTDRGKLQEDIEAACHGLNNLPVLSDKRYRLPVFASAITANPHAFDEDASCGQIFLHALAYQFNVDRPRSAEEKAELYYAAGILFDEVSNYVLCNGLKAFMNGHLHPGWEGFYQCKESLQVSLANLSTLDRVSSSWKKVYVLENAGVFAAVLDKLSKYNPPLICTYGQVKIASLVLMDMLVKEGTTIYYSGDFDPEGLKIADKLKIRYGEKLKLWRYNPQDYKNALSNETINNSRIKKMDSLKTPELLHLSQHIKQYARSGYQELILDDIIKDIAVGSSYELLR